MLSCTLNILQENINVRLYRFLMCCSEISGKDLEQELSKFNRDVVELKNDFRTLRAKLDQLEKQYQESKRLNPAQRFVALKEMIKAATMPVTS